MFRDALRLRSTDHEQRLLQFWAGHDLGLLFIRQQSQTQIEVIL